MEEGQLTEVETPLRQAEQAFHDEQQTDDEISAAVALAKSMLADWQGRRSPGKDGQHQRSLRRRVTVGRYVSIGVFPPGVFSLPQAS